MTDIANTNAPLVSSISSTLLRLLPHMNSSTTGGQSATDSDIHTGDNHSMTTDASCSSCNSSCPSFVNEQDVFGHYRLINTLGAGEFGKVKLGICVDTDEKVAIKIVKKKIVGAKLAKVEREIQILKALNHPHIVKLIEVVETDARIGIVLDYALGGELFEYVWSHKSLDEDNAKNLFAQLISGVNHMHSKGVVHRDLKLENLLFLDAQQTHLVISDFGFSNKDNNNLLSTSCGSPTYAAPELIYPSDSYNGATADVWSCGVILYCMICGYLPFDDDPQNPESANLRRLYQHIRSSTLSFPEFVSDDAKNLVQQMLRPDPVNRCTIQDVINHPWLQSRYSTLFVAPSEQLEQQTLDSTLNHGDSQQCNLDSTAANADPLEKNTVKENHHKIRHRHRHHGLYQQELCQQQNDHQDVAIQTDGVELQHPTGTLPPTPRSLMDTSKLSSTSETNNTDSTTSGSRLKNKELPLLPPLPPFTPEEHAALNDIGLEEHQRQRKPSLRRQKKIRPSLMNAQPMPLISTTNRTDTTNTKPEDWSDDENTAFGIRRSLLGKDNSILLHKNNKRITSNSTNGTQGNSVQNMKSISLPLLNQASQICMTVDSTISATNLNDGAIDDQSAATKKRRRRFASFLTKTHPGPRPQPQRSQSTRIPKKQIDDDDDDQGTTVKQKDTSTSTTTTTTTTTPVTRRRTMTQAMKAWIHKKKPFAKEQQPSSFSSLSRTSSSFVGSVDANNSNQSATNHHHHHHHHHHRGDQQQQHKQQQHQVDEDEEQQEAHHYLVPSSLEATPADQSTMRTFTHAQDEHLTSMAPGQLILTLVRVLTALGFDVQHRSSYQLMCIRKSHHPPASPHHHFYSWNYHGSIKQKKKNGNNKTATVSTSPIYGPPELDQGHEVEFTVEVCRSLLSDIYVVDIQHACGDYASFQFLRSKVLSLLNLNA